MKKFVGVLLILFATTAAWAGEPIDERVEADEDTTVLIENVHGQVQVTGWDRPEVQWWKCARVPHRYPGRGR